MLKFRDPERKVEVTAKWNDLVSICRGDKKSNQINNIRSSNTLA